MPEHFKALVVILSIAIPVFALAKVPISGVSYQPQTFRRQRALWLCVTFFVFFSHSFWISNLLCAMVLYIAARKDKAPLGLYFLLLFAYPHFSLLIPGVGPIEHIIQVNYPRILNLVILAPIALHLYRVRDTRLYTSRAPDLAFLGFLVIMLTAHIPNSSIVGTARSAVYIVIDFWVPYYVASRAMKSINQYREIAAGFLVAAVILGLIAVFESTRNWLLYESLRGVLGVPPAAVYLPRTDGGPLRAMATQVHPIVLGYVLMVALGMSLLLWGRLKPSWRQYAALMCLIAGLGATISRGPWLGAFAMMLVLILLGPNRTKRFTVSMAAGGSIVTIMLSTPFGQRVIDHLPFIGTVDPGSVEYRTRLFDAAMQTFLQNPIFGDTQYLENPIMEQMRQGAGLIDIVNSYLGVALEYGLFGLAFFLAALLIPFFIVWRARKRTLGKNSDMEWLGRILLAVLTGALITIATTSSIGTIPTILWLLVGLCVSYGRIASAMPQGPLESEAQRKILAHNN